MTLRRTRLSLSKGDGAFARHGVPVPAPLRRPATLLSLAALLAVASLSSFLTYGYVVQRTPYAAAVGEPADVPARAVPQAPLPPPPRAKPHAPSAKIKPEWPEALNGPPAARFRDNLRNDTNYITSWVSVGWTNDVMAHGNLLYMALLTHRVPILPPFAPVHVGAAAGLVSFGEVFDVPRLSRALGIPVLEWHQVKDVARQPPELEALGCWSLFAQIDGAPKHSLTAAAPAGVDVSFTPVPRGAWMGHDSHAQFWPLVRLAYPERRAHELQFTHPAPSPQLGLALPPDERVLCFDMMYYLCVDEVYEWERDYSPAWNEVGTHLRWSADLVQLGEFYLSETFGVPAGDPIPPYIALHVRHGDFVNHYCNGLTKEQCLTPLSRWAREVETLKRELAQSKHVSVEHVVVLSDEQDPAWWGEVRALGWHRIDHARFRTAESYGAWYEVFVEAFVQSAGRGFLGTKSSTMSLLALRRTQDWNDGLGWLVQWNMLGQHPDAVQGA